MRRKNLWGRIFLTAAAVSMLAGCSTKGGQTTGGSSSGETKKDGEQKVTIAVWNEPNKDEALNMYAQAEKATGIKVEVTVIPESDYSSKLNQMVSTGDDSADIYVIWENDIANFAKAGGIISMDDYLKNSSIQTKDFIDAVSAL